jgi:hypothetical protein
MLTRLGGNRSFASSTTPKMKPFAPTIDAAHADRHRSKLVNYYSYLREVHCIFFFLDGIYPCVTINVINVTNHILSDFVFLSFIIIKRKIVNLLSILL